MQAHEMRNWRFSRCGEVPRTCTITTEFNSMTQTTSAWCEVSEIQTRGCDLRTRGGLALGREEELERVRPREDEMVLFGGRDFEVWYGWDDGQQANRVGGKKGRSPKVVVKGRTDRQ